jgi:hypothetical protein
MSAPHACIVSAAHGTWFFPLDQRLPVRAHRLCRNYFPSLLPDAQHHRTSQRTRAVGSDLMTSHVSVGDDASVRVRGSKR